MSQEPDTFLTTLLFHPRTGLTTLQTPDETVDSQLGADQTASLLTGIHSLLAYAHEEHLPSITIQLSDIYVYNVMTRFLPVWKRHDWHTSKNQSAPHRESLIAIDHLLSQVPSVYFRYVSSNKTK